MLTKSLLVTEAVLIRTAEIESTIGDALPAFQDHIGELTQVLAKGPNPDFTPPLIAALHTCFNTPAEPIIGTILHNLGFDYRFITGKPRRFSALKAGKAIDPQIAQLWQRTQQAGSTKKV